MEKGVNWIVIHGENWYKIHKKYDRDKPNFSTERGGQWDCDET